MKMTAQIITAAKVGFGIYVKYGVKKENASITNPAVNNSIISFSSLNHFFTLPVYTPARGVRMPLAPPTAALEKEALTG